MLRQPIPPAQRQSPREQKLPEWLISRRFLPEQASRMPGFRQQQNARGPCLLFVVYRDAGDLFSFGVGCVRGYGASLAIGSEHDVGG
jgi:hypothetical protein